MRVDEAWQQLLASIRGWARVEEVGPGRTVVTVSRDDGTTTRAELVMTPDDYDEMWSVAWGEPAGASDAVRRAVLGLPPGQRYLVYAAYALEPSDAPELPEDPEAARVAAHLRDHPGAAGRWVVLGGDGVVVDEPGPPPA